MSPDHENCLRAMRRAVDLIQEISDTAGFIGGKFTDERVAIKRCARDAMNALIDASQGRVSR